MGQWHSKVHNRPGLWDSKLRPVRKMHITQSKGSNFVRNASNAANRAGAMAQQGCTTSRGNGTARCTTGQGYGTASCDRCAKCIYTQSKGSNFVRMHPTLLTKPGQWHSKVHSRPGLWDSKLRPVRKMHTTQSKGSNFVRMHPTLLTELVQQALGLHNREGKSQLAVPNRLALASTMLFPSDEAQRLKAIAIAGGAEAQELAAKGLAALKQVPVPQINFDADAAKKTFAAGGAMVAAFFLDVMKLEIFRDFLQFLGIMVDSIEFPDVFKNFIGSIASFLMPVSATCLPRWMR